MTAAGVLIAGLVGFLASEYSHWSSTEILTVPSPTPAYAIDEGRSHPAGGPSSTSPSASVETALPRAVEAAPMPGAPAASAEVGRSAGQSLNGWWSMTSRIESTSHQSIENLNLGYRLLLTQHGNQVTGRGHRWMENGRPLPPSQQTAIAVNGNIEGHHVVLRYTEQGTRGTTTGTFAYEMIDAGALRGTFSGNLAGAKGSTQAHRVPSPDVF